MRSLLLILLLGVPTPVLGGQIVKNGGAIVVGECYPHQDVHELLDFYEARILRGWTINLGTGNSVDEKLEIMLQRLGQVDPERETLLREWYRSFERDRAWLNNGADLPRVDDIGEIETVLPGGCGIRQAAGQRIPDNPGFDPYYIFHEAYFGSLSDNDKAGLIFHELIYRDGVNRGHTQSKGARFMTALFATTMVDDGLITEEIYKDVLFRNAYDTYGYRGLRIFDHQVSSIEEAEAFCNERDLGAFVPEVSNDSVYHITWPFEFEYIEDSSIGAFLDSIEGGAGFFGFEHRFTDVKGVYYIDRSLRRASPGSYDVPMFPLCAWPEEI